jgi:hypothetical protein
LEIAVPVKGVKTLTLKVTDGGDLDLGDVANWGAARVLRSDTGTRITRMENGLRGEEKEGESQKEGVAR